MIGFEEVEDAPLTARFHREALEQIVQSVEERVYCAVLGPRLCGKTLLLHYIEKNLAPLLGWTCFFVNLLDLRLTTQGAFFADLIRLTAQRLTAITGKPLPVPEESVASSAVYRAFLSESLEIIQRDVVIIFDPLDALPTDLVQALLTSLRASYMDQQMMENQVTVIVSGALSLATLAVGESSPFRGICRRVFVGDLSGSASQALIQELFSEEGISTTDSAVQKLLEAASGDVFLMRKISQLCSQQVRSRSNGLLHSRDVTTITNRFLRGDVFQYAPLTEAVRLIEDNPDLLMCILKLLEQESVKRADLPLPLSPDLDPLFLTGVVERDDGDCYRLQNLIYRRYLEKHFHPGRVGHVLAMTGRWDEALDYLEASVLQGNRQSRADLLPATINSMYASQDLLQAVHFLRRGLTAAFNVSDARVWFSPPQEKFLRLISPMGSISEGETWMNQQIAVSADRLEARSFRSRVPLRGQEEEQHLVQALPLMIPGSPPVGVVTIYADPLNDVIGEQRERDLQLVGFLNQAARALQAVNLRRQELVLAGRVQASLLPDAPPEVTGWQIAATWRPARETSGDFYDFVTLPGGKIGIVIADVVDKGMGAALLMALSRTLIRTYAEDYPDQPEYLLRVANARIISDIRSGLFVTMFYGILDPQTGSLTYCNAGHPPPFIISHEEGEILERLGTTGMPLGISSDTDWKPSTVQIPAGAVLLLYTDGILDAQNQQQEFFGIDQMLEVVRSQVECSAQAIQEELISQVFAFAGSEPQLDDIAMIVFVRDL
jgi:serine phosphatase RsbU (regulator of sigma subunit)